MNRSLYQVGRHWLLKTLVLSYFIGFCLPADLLAQSSGNIYLLIGGYTKASDDKGISVYEFNLESGDLTLRTVTGHIENPSYLAISKVGHKVYAVSEQDGGSGAVVAYEFFPSTGILQYNSQAGAGGDGPCYISIDDAATHVFVANYGSGSLGAISLKIDGTLDANSVQSIQHTGGSINKDNQNRPHAHSAVLSPDNKFLLCANLGNDKVYTYRFEAGATQSLQPANPAWVSLTPGSGPRHISFHPNGKFVYVVNELNGSVDFFTYKNGALTPKQNITMLPGGFSGIIEAADIHISPDGKFLYASNRDIQNEIVIYAIDKNGKLTLAGRQSDMISIPRNFVIDPSGKFLLVANMKTNEVLVFNRDAQTGLLTFSGKKISVPAPACLKFIPR